MINDPALTEASASPGQLADDSGALSQADPDLLRRIAAAVGDLQESFESKIRYDEVREHQVQAMHQELDSHRKGLYQQILKPVLTDLVGVYDDISSALPKPGTTGTASLADGEGRLIRMMASLRDSVEEILERNGVTAFTAEGDVIDRSRQRVIELTGTDQPDLDRRLAARLRPGFELDGRVLRPEWVTAYRYSANQGQPLANGGNDTPGRPGHFHRC